MDILCVLQYGGIATLILLLGAFEFMDKQSGKYVNTEGYKYYTDNNISVRIRQVLASHYRVYVHDACPVPTKTDRYGAYFALKARSASDAEHQIDELYRSC
ncbi:MAG: hypothetical protein ACI3WQ_11865 [Faecousia sp.]